MTDTLKIQSELSLVDQSHLNELVELMEADFAKLINDFLSYASSQIESLQKMTNRDRFGETYTDLDDLVLELHSFKGCCRNVGATRLSVFIESVEKKLKLAASSKEGCEDEENESSSDRRLFLREALASIESLSQDTEKEFKGIMSQLGLA